MHRTIRTLDRSWSRVAPRATERRFTLRKILAAREGTPHLPLRGEISSAALCAALLTWIA